MYSLQTLRGPHLGRSLVGLALVAALTVGCGGHNAYLVPAPQANLANGGRAAMASADGITIRVTPNSWDGTPRNLHETLTPLQVRIENHSKQPLRLAYEDFNLEMPTGELLYALPPSEIRGTQYVGENRGDDPRVINVSAQRGGRGRAPGRREGRRDES